MALELIAQPAQFSPLVKFFIGFLLVVAWAGGSLLFVYWISTMYGEEEDYDVEREEGG